jgi:hypothetical protein
MEILLNYRRITDKEDIDILNKFTRIKTQTFNDFTQYTYSIATTKKGATQFEDYIYSNYPLLVEVIPRGFSIVTKKGKVISILEGPCKFSGKTTVDEDLEDEQDTEDYDTKDSDAIYDHGKIIKWLNSNSLEIIETEKANGKFAIFKAIIVDGIIYLHTGSKNKHLFFALEQIDDYITSPDSGEIISSILLDVKKNIHMLTNTLLINKFSENYSLCGELCDGQHFVVGDNTISWFGLFKTGKSMETFECFEFMKSIGIQTVQWSLVYFPDLTRDTTDSESMFSLAPESKKAKTEKEKLEDLDKVFLLSRCKLNEGSVLRCRNIHSNEIVLVKTKSVSYITKRFMRQSILKGYAHMVDSVKKRFIDAHKYHGLDTNSSIRMCNQLIKFGFWLMNKEYPVAVLGVTQVSSSRGSLKNGFCHYWTQFLMETGEIEQTFTPEDFGDFDEIYFSTHTQPYIPRSFSNPACVVFFQGLQGSGKSTLGQSVQLKFAELGKKVTIVEQDRFYGCTLSCQGYLYHNIKNSLGPDIILVTRCNANPKQYEKYLQICHKSPSIVTFVIPHILDELYLAVCLSGVLNRSDSGDSLLVGRREFPIEEATNFIISNYKDMKLQKTENKINIYRENLKLKENAKKAYDASTISNTNKIFVDWVKMNKDELHSIRNPISYLTMQIIDVVNKSFNGENLIFPDKLSYVGLGVQDNDKQKLLEFAKEHNNLIDYSKANICLSHCVQMTLSGSSDKTFKTSKTTSSSSKYFKPLDAIDATIDALVIRKSDGSCCFRIRRDSIISKKEHIGINVNHIPHIAGIVPYGASSLITNQFVGLTDDSVVIIPIKYELVLITFYA